MKELFFGSRVFLLKIFAGLFILFYWFPAQGSQIDNAKLNPLTKTAERTINPVAASSVTSPVKIITSRELQRKGIVTVSDALNRLSEISTVSNGVGGLTNIRLFGLPAKYTKILIDGINISDPSGFGSVDLSNLDNAPVDKIEIVEGAQSGLYGSSAAAGVINIITKHGKGKPTVSLSQSIGTKKQIDSTISVQGSRKAFSFAGSLSQRYIGGLSKGDFWNGSSFQRNGVEKDPFRNQTGYLNLGYRIDNKNSLKLTLLNIKTISYLDEYPYYEYAGKPISHGYHEDIIFNAQKIDFIHQDNPLDFEISFANSFTQRHYKNDPGYYGDSFYKGKRDIVTVKSDYRLNKSILLSAGADVEASRAKTPEIYSRNREAVWIAPSFTKDAFFVNTALRLDKYKTFGNEFTYKIGTGYNFPTDTTLKANFGTIFLAPTLYQMYNTTYGNINLNPERGKTVDITVIQKLEENRISLTAFKSFINDAIDFDYATYKYFNKNRYTAKGITASGTLNSVNHFIFNLSGTWQNAKEKKGGSWQADRVRLPRFKANWDISYFPISRLSFDLSGVYVGSDKSSKWAKISDKQIGRYSVWNAAVQYKATKNLTLLAKLDNIFDKFYETAEGYQTEPRTATIGLKATF